MWHIEHEGKILVYHAQDATLNSFTELGLTDRRRYENR